MSKGHLTHAASLERTGCWRWNKRSLTQNSMASAQPLLMSHFDLGTFLQYSCLQIWALTCMVEVFRDIGESDTASNTPSGTGSSCAQASDSMYGASLLEWHKCWKWPNLLYKFFLLKNTRIHSCFPHRSWKKNKLLWIFSDLDTWLCEAEYLAIYLQSEERCSSSGSSATLQTLPW